MAAVTSVMRVQQLLLARVEDILKPYGVTFAAYEALRLLAFTRAGSLPMGKLGARLMVHPAAVTNAVGKLEQRGLVRRSMSPEDRRIVLATITDDGRSLVDEATAALNEAAFGLPGLTPEQAADLVGALRAVRALAGDLVTGDGSPAVLPYSPVAMRLLTHSLAAADPAGAEQQRHAEHRAKPFGRPEYPRHAVGVLCEVERVLVGGRRTGSLLDRPGQYDEVVSLSDVVEVQRAARACLYPTQSPGAGLAVDQGRRIGIVPEKPHGRWLRSPRPVR
jgi:DNA-binding MarR family transcriptional regulator